MFREDPWKEYFETSLFRFFKYTKSLSRSFQIFRATLMFPLLKRKADSPHTTPPCCFWTSCTSGACDRGLLFALGALLRKELDMFTCCSACGDSTILGERPGMPALGSQSERRVHLTHSSGALAFSTACTALLFCNPAPGLEKPFPVTLRALQDRQ